MIFSEFQLPVRETVSNHQTQTLLIAPRIPNNRQKVIWSQDGITNYSEMVQPALQSIRLSWYHPDSPSSFSILLALTNFVLNTAASLTNKTVSLDKHPTHNNNSMPKAIKAAKLDRAIKLYPYFVFSQLLYFTAMYVFKIV